jgi:hypothetical protein
VPYKLSERHLQDTVSRKNNDPNKVDLGKVASVFIVFGIIGLITAWVYSMETGEVLSRTFQPSQYGKEVTYGPLRVEKRGAVYEVSIDAKMPVNSWSFVEGQVLDQNREYLFSFGKELWHERGRDSDGTWQEAEDEYSMEITFPEAGTYYLSFKTESNRQPYDVKVTVAKQRGSSLPHLWFGIITLVIGIVLNEKRNATFGNEMANWQRISEYGTDEEKQQLGVRITVIMVGVGILFAILAVAF